MCRLAALSHLDPDLVYAAYFGVVTEAIGLPADP